MKEYKYIDKIVKDTISEMKVPVNSTWKDITEKIKNTPKEPVNNNNSFLSSLTSKIIASVLTAFSVIGAIFMINHNNSAENITLPQKSNYEISTTRKVKIVENVDNVDNFEIVNTKNNSITKQDLTDNQEDNTSTTIITIEKTEIDTIK